MLTVDAPVFGRRLEDLRNGFRMPAGIKFPNLSADVPSANGDAGAGLPDLSFGMHRFHLQHRARLFTEQRG